MSFGEAGLSSGLWFLIRLLFRLWFRLLLRLRCRLLFPRRFPYCLLLRSSLRFLLFLLRRTGAVLVHREDDGTDLHLVTLLDLDFLDDAGDGGRNFDGGLVGLELDDRLILGDRVADLDEHAGDVALLDVLTQFGNFEFLHESTPNDIHTHGPQRLRDAENISYL